MMRISCAVPATPRTMAGIGRCLVRSQTFAMLQGASMKSGEKRPPTFAPKYAKPTYMTTSASRNPGMASPMKPMNVNA